MRLGRIQRIIMDQFDDDDEKIYFGVGARIQGLEGMYLEEVQPALDRLVKRGLLRKTGMHMYQRASTTK